MSPVFRNVDKVEALRAQFLDEYALLVSDYCASLCAQLSEDNNVPNITGAMQANLAEEVGDDIIKASKVFETIEIAFGKYFEKRARRLN